MNRNTKTNTNREDKTNNLFRVIMLKCVDEGGEDEDAHREEEGEHAKLFVAVFYWKLYFFTLANLLVYIEKNICKFFVLTMLQLHHKVFSFQKSVKNMLQN